MPEPAQHLNDRRQKRDGAIRATFAAAVIGRVLSAGFSLALVPLALGRLGPEAFGLWVTLASLTLLLGATDFGLGLAMQNEVATTLGRERPERAPALFFTTLLGLAITGTVLFCLGFLVAGSIGWGGLFHLQQPDLASEATAAVRASLLLIMLGLPLGAASRLASACQWGWLASAWNAVGAAGQFAAVAWTGGTGLTFAEFVLITGLPPVMAQAGLLAHLLLRLRWGWRDLTLATSGERTTLVHRSWEFCLPQVSAALIYNAAAPLIGVVAGTSAVTAYSVAQRIFGLFGQFQQMVLAPLWPAYTEAQARKDHEWIRDRYRRSLVGTALGICLPLVVVAALLPWLVALWTGPGAVDLPPSLVWLLCAWNVLLAASNAPAYLLGGLGRMRRLGWISFGGCAAMGIGLLTVAPHGGAATVVATLVAGYLLIIVPATFAESSAALRALDGTIRRGAPGNHLPEGLRRLIVRRLSGPPRGPAVQSVRLAIYKVDRLGDFVLSLGAIRALLQRYGDAHCLLIVSSVAAPLAAAEFPRTPRLVLPVSAGGIIRELLPATWRHRRRFAGLRCDTLVCLRHQREAYHETSLSWLAAGRVVQLSPDDYPAVVHGRSAELEAHRRVVSLALGREVAADEVRPQLTSFQGATTPGILVCPFSFDPTRDISVEVLLPALQAWNRRRAGPVRLSGAPADRSRLAHWQARLIAGGLVDVVVETPADQLGFIRQVLTAEVVLTVDSAGAHVATALDKPTVVMQGGAFAGVFGPWQRSERQVWLQHALPCFGCGSHCSESENLCLTQLSPARITAALEEMIQ